MAREVKIAILGDARDFQRAMQKATGSADGFGGKLAAFGKVAAVGLGAAAAGAVALGKTFVDAAIESQKITAQTEAVIKSMGNAAGVSSKQVADLSTKLSLKTGVDDELIQSGSNLLLTFGKIRNEVGKGNAIFDRATTAALDMSVAMGMDMKSASILVGKALNDPIKGLTSLTRSGIQFTDQQKDQIKAMVAAGDVMGAQKVILGELDKQFGGSAAAQATATDKLKVAWGNLQEQLGARLLPVVEKVATWLAANLPAAMATAEAAFARIRPTIEAVVGSVQEKWPQIQATVTAVVAAVRGVIEGFVSVITTLWENFGNNILEFVQRIWPAIQQVIQGALDIIRGIVQTVTSLIQGDWSGVWEGIKRIVSGAWSAIQGLVKGSLELLRASVGVGLEVVGSVFKGFWNGLTDWLGGLVDKVASVASSLWAALKSGLKAAIDWILKQIDRMLGPLDEVAGKVGGIVGKLGGSVSGVLGKIPGFAQGGVVPGAVGSPQLIVAHGGERVSMRGQSGGGGGMVNNFYLNGDPEANAQAVRRELLRIGKRNGTIFGDLA